MTVLPGGIAGIQQLLPGMGMITANGLAIQPGAPVGVTPSFGPPTTMPLLPPRVLPLQVVPPLVQTVPLAAPANRIYVGSIFWDVTADDLKQAFQIFGPIKSIQLMPNPETGKHKGFGFIEYETAEAADLAIQHMNGKEIAGRQLKVNHAVTTTQQPVDLLGTQAPGTTPPNAMALAALKALGVLNPAMMGAFGGFGAATPGFINIPGVPTPVPVSAATLAAAGLLSQSSLAQAAMPVVAPIAGAAAATVAAATPQQQVKVEEPLSNEENVTINQQQRLQLMQKLARMGEASRCVVLRNMVGADDLDDDLETDVTSECSKFGIVERVVIYQEHEQNTAKVTVKIFILFSQSAEADKATKALNGRWFGGRQIKSELFPMEKFNKQDYNG
eukprot:TRINITY_DN1802_c0_g1_i2.p1 TRINITY_DN1802_c0_g1~~TRINITY_DN1802_c0_g1_i2.p1  ORF type:complete len:388 (-),score=180.69 TRINITY_DN1802_c0_g1_i2:327-1490(-)